MKAFFPVITRLLLLFYLSSTFLSATHIHNEVQEHESDCKVCIVVKNIQSADVPLVDELSQNLFATYEPIVSQQNLLVIQTSKGFNANAPPFFS